MRKPSAQTLFLGAVVIGSCLLVGAVAVTGWPGGTTHYDPPPGDPAPVSAVALADIPFDGAQAYEYLKQLCAIGPRPSGSDGMQRQQKLLADHFEKLGGKVSWQELTVAHPLRRGTKVPMRNLIVQWHPERKTRVLLCAHYDTRPLPDRDPVNPRGTFVGANDGASGVAVLMELGKHMKDLKGQIGVDFVLFDGEELVYPAANAFVDEAGEYFVGSQHFADQYRAKPPEHRYAAGILLDMVGDSDLQLFFEANSIRSRQTRQLTLDVWGVAERLGLREFVKRVKHELRDDHLPLNNTAKIPTIDVIDFDYPHWHTRGDTPDKCSAESLAKVGWVMLEYLKSINR